jgi:hypothetical protein
VLALSQQDQSGWVEIGETSWDWRVRRSTPALLYFGDGWRAKTVAAQHDLHLDTAYERRKDWLAAGFVSLTNKHRCGAACSWARRSVSNAMYGPQRASW